MMIIILAFLLLTLKSFIDCTIIVIMQHVILYVVCLLSNCTVFIVLYSMYQSLAVFIVIVQCQFWWKNWVEKYMQVGVDV